MTDGDVKLGAICWNQYTDWPSFREAGIRAEGLGFDSLWTWDHLYPIVGDHEGPMLEGYLALAAWAEATERATHRPDGRGQHVPQPGARGEDDHDARPHQRRAGGPRHRRRLVRDRARRLRHRVRRIARASGCAGWTRRCRSCAACSTATSRRATAATTPPRRSGTPAAGPGAPADPHRRGRRAQDAADRGPLRGRLQRGRWLRAA